VLLVYFTDQNVLVRKMSISFRSCLDFSELIVLFDI